MGVRGLDSETTSPSSGTTGSRNCGPSTAPTQPSTASSVRSGRSALTRSTRCSGVASSSRPGSGSVSGASAACQACHAALCLARSAPRPCRPRRRCIPHSCCHADVVIQSCACGKDKPCSKIVCCSKILVQNCMLLPSMLSSRAFPPWAWEAGLRRARCCPGAGPAPRRSRGHPI